MLPKQAWFQKLNSSLLVFKYISLLTANINTEGYSNFFRSVGVIKLLCFFFLMDQVQNHKEIGFTKVVAS